MRIKTESIAFVLIASILLACSAAGAAQVSSTAVPVCFVKNMGQTDEQVLYFADANGIAVYLTAAGEVISTGDPATAVRIVYPGSNSAVVVTGADELLGKANFLIGNDQDAWITDVPLFASVGYDDLYPGIDLVYHGGINSLKKEFVIKAGADPSEIQMQYSGQDGLALDQEGALLITTAAGTFLESAPYSYQIVNGQESAVSSRFVIGEQGSVSFAVGAYDPSLPLVIDPVYNFSTYLGGTQDDRGTGVGMDDLGNVYVVGSTQSTQFPMANGPTYQEHLNGSWDIFASKFSPDGSVLIYSTYIGGNKTDMAGGMVVNNATGEVTFTGSTTSLNYPNIGVTDLYGGNTDAIITRLNAAGTSLVWSRLIDGNKTDVGTGIALNNAGNPDVVVVGYTSSNYTAGWLPDGGLIGATDGFVVKVDNSGNYLGGRYIGGTNYDYAYGVTIQPNQWFIFVTGTTKSLNFPTIPGSFRTTNSGASDAFVTKLIWDLTLDRSTYLGGSSNDVGMGIDLDPNGYPYITGYTESPISPINLFPVTPNPMGFQTTFGGGQWDAFVTKMEPDLSALNYSTYLGGSDDDQAYGIAVDANGTAFVTGWTMSTNFPTKFPTQATKGEGFRIPDAFVTQMNQTGRGLVFSTYLGGTYYDEGDAIAITDDGLNITVTGYTESINFPIVNAYQPYLAGFPAVRFTDAFVTKYIKLVPIVDFIGEPTSGCNPLTVNFTDLSTSDPYPITGWFWEFGDGSNSTEQNPTHVYTLPGMNQRRYNVTLTATNQDGSASLTKTKYIRVCPSFPVLFHTNKTIGCVDSNSTIRFYNDTVNDPIQLYWDFGDGTNATTNGTVNPNFINHKYLEPGLYTVSLTAQFLCCNNTTIMTDLIDIRAVPHADFNATPTSGLIPLDVQFFDNSTGRPSNWTWTFGAQQGGSNEQNPEHTYTTKGSYKVKLEACNFCGCDNETKNAYIQAGIPNLYFSPDTLVVPTNDTTPITLYLQEAENGLSGYNLTVFWLDSVHGNITAVQFPPWATNKTKTPLPDYIVNITAVDMLNQVNPGATNITLATLDLEGNISTFMSTIDMNVSVNELDDDFGNLINTNNIPATITVVRLLPFPNKVKPPTDPFDDQVYWDVNGNGKIDFNDVTTFFQNMQWIRDNQYEPFFDYNGNGNIDFADLILLFNKVPYP
jgi:PKD repeat protein